MSMGVHQVLIDANVMSKFSTREEKANYSKCQGDVGQTYYFFFTRQLFD